MHLIKFKKLDVRYFLKLVLSISCLGMLISCEEILFEENLTHSKVDILTPSDGSRLQATSINFRWSPVNGAVAYQIQIASPSFEQAGQILLDEEVEETSFNEELPRKDYEWRVRAVNSGYKSPYTTAKFKIESNEDFSSNTIQLLSPADNYLTNQTMLNFEWRELQDAISYRVQLRKDGELIEEMSLTDVSVEMELPEGESSWRVRGEKDGEYTLYSERKVTVDTVPPTPKKLLSPQDEMILTNSAVEFRWENDAVVNDEIDSVFIYRDEGLSNLVEKGQGIDSYNANLEDNETYYWLVNTYDKAGNISEPGGIYSFSINEL